MKSLSVVTLLTLVCSILSFQRRLKQWSARMRSSISMDALPNVAVAGLAGGAAETVACKLLEAGATISAIFDKPPYSPQLASATKSKHAMVYYGSNIDELVDMSSQQPYVGGISGLLNSKVLIAIDDNGDANLRMRTPEDIRKDEYPGENFIRTLSSQLPSSVKAVICAGNAKLDKESRKGLAAVLGPRGNEAFRVACGKIGIPFTGIQYGQLTGGVPGAEPLPFKGMPLQEPELHPSYVLRSVVCTSSLNNKYAADEMCTREALSDVVVETIKRSTPILPDLALPSNEDTLVVSIAGPAMSHKDWDTMFTRMQTKGNVELLRIEFNQILKPDAFVNWICDTWFPQALIDADAATILRGARPVRATKLSNGGSAVVRIAWEDIRPDLSVESAGALEIAVVSDSSPPYISVRRVVNSGEKKMLPGEGQLMDRLIESINKDAYKKKFCTILNK